MESLNKVQENLFTISKEFINVETHILSAKSINNKYQIQSVKNILVLLINRINFVLETITLIHKSLNSLLIIIK